MNKIWIVAVVLLALASPTFAADPTLPTGPFEIVTQQITKNVKIVRIGDGDNACYLILRQPISAGTVQPAPNVGGFACLPQAGAIVTPEE